MSGILAGSVYPNEYSSWWIVVFRLRDNRFLLYSIWCEVDLLVQVEVTGEYERTPVVTANTILTLLKQTGIG